MIDGLIKRVGQEMAGSIFAPLWTRSILKRDVFGIHGTLFYDNALRREFVPSTKREVDWDNRS